MKREKDIIKVGDGFDKWLNINHLKERSLSFKVSENWKEIVGNTIYHHTSRIDVRLPKIYLKLDSSSLKEILYNDSQLLIDKINQFLNQEAVKEIIFT